jgi:tetratricopeptide (TPR) repeat protein
MKYFITLLFIATIGPKGNSQSAETDYEKTLKLGASFFNDNKFTESKAELLKIIDDYHKSEVEFSKDLYLGNGLSQEQMDKFAEKTFYVQQTNFYLGQIELHYNNPYSALNYFEASMELDSTNVNALSGIGDSYLAMFRIPKAIEYFTRAISIEPNAYCYMKRASAFSDLKRHKLAIDDMSKAIDLLNNCLTCYHNRGFYYFEDGQYKEALKDFEKVLSSEKDDSYALNNKAMTLFKLGDSKTALALIDQALLVDKSNYYANRNKAIIFYAQGKKDLACNELKKSMEGGLDIKYDKELHEIINKCK